MNLATQKNSVTNFLPCRVSSLAIRLNNFLSTRTRKKTFSFSRSKQVVTVQLLQKNNVLSRRNIILKVKIWGKTSVILLSNWPAIENLQEYISEKGLEELPEDLALITVNTAYFSFIEDVSKLLSTKIEIVDFIKSNKHLIRELNEDHRYNEKLETSFSAKIGNEPRIYVKLIFDKEILPNIINIIKNIPQYPHFSTNNTFVPVYLEYGNSYCPRSIIHTLEEGDILMVDSKVDREKRNLKFRFLSHRAFLAEKQDQSETYNFLEEIAMDDSIPDQSIPLSEIPLNITFDIGKVSLKLEEMEKIGVGYTLNINRNLNDLVTLRIENKIIGHGELVNIGDRVGVRITQLSDKINKS